MSNKRLYQFLYSKQPKLTLINGLITVGSTGAVSAFAAPGVQGVTRLGVGIYKIKLQDNYYAPVSLHAAAYSGISGSSVAGGSFVATTLYQVITLGTTTQAQWVTAGCDVDYTVAIGTVFVAAGIGAGTGTVKAITPSNITNIEFSQSLSGNLVNLNPSLGRGSSFILSCFGLPSSGQTPLATDPASGSQIVIDMWLRDSSVIPY